MKQPEKPQKKGNIPQKLILQSHKTSPPKEIVLLEKEKAEGMEYIDVPEEDNDEEYELPLTPEEGGKDKPSSTLKYIPIEDEDNDEEYEEIDDSFQDDEEESEESEDEEEWEESEEEWEESEDEEESEEPEDEEEWEEPEDEEEWEEPEDEEESEEPEDEEESEEPEDEEESEEPEDEEEWEEPEDEEESEEPEDEEELEEPEDEEESEEPEDEEESEDRKTAQTWGATSHQEKSTTWQTLWRKNQRAVLGFFFALFMVSLSYGGLFYNTSQEVNDAIYQKTSMTNPNICIIGIDGASIDTLGSFPFDRQVFADLIEILNGSDTPPMAIAFDVLFTGESNPESDKALVDAVSRWDNIVLACSGNYGTALVENQIGEVQLHNSHLLSMNLPFPDLLEVANLGHINSSLDEDGILREGILYISDLSGEEIPSLSLALYMQYAKATNTTIGSLPDNRWYLPFTSKSGGYYDGYSLSRVLSGEIPPSLFADKLVFLGPYTVGLQDHFYTAVDHNNMMFGVEYQANALETLIKQDFVLPIASLYHQLFLGILMWILFQVVFDKSNQDKKALDQSIAHKIISKNTLVLVAVGCGYVALCQYLFSKGFITNVFYVPLGCFLLFLLTIISNAYQEYKNRAYITDTFKRYVAPEVVDNILANGVDSLHLGGSSMNVSVMFIDVRNFTPMSEKFKEEPEVLLDILNRLLDSMAKTIMDNGGTLDKFIGDAIMCFWGAPVAQEDHVYLSVKTAVEICENLEDIIADIKRDHEHAVSIGIGIQCGDAVAGNIGSMERSEYTVIGDTVNTAARLESNAKGDHNVILISHKVYREVKDQFAIKKVQGGLALKGKEGRLKAYRVYGKLERAEED